jgi:hypothetical protein
MITIDLTQTELFKSFAEMGTGDTYVDLHNEFNCYSINFSRPRTQLSLSFKASINNLRAIKHVELVFKNAVVELMNFKIDHPFDESSLTIDQLYRGRFENQSNELAEVSNEGKFYYYISFCEDHSFQVFADSVTAELTNIFS